MAHRRADRSRFPLLRRAKTAGLPYCEHRVRRAYEAPSARKIQFERPSAACKVAAVLP